MQLASVPWTICYGKSSSTALLPVEGSFPTYLLEHPERSLLAATVGMPGTDEAIEEQGQEGGRMTDRVPVNVFENVLAGEASRQVIVSIIGIRISASTVTTEVGAM